MILGTHFELAPDARISFAEDAPVLDSNRRQIGKVVDVSRDETGVEVMLMLLVIPHDLRVMIKPSLREVEVSFSVGDSENPIV